MALLLALFIANLSDTLAADSKPPANRSVVGFVFPINFCGIKPARLVHTPIVPPKSPGVVRVVVKCLEPQPRNFHGLAQPVGGGFDGQPTRQLLDGSVPQRFVPVGFSHANVLELLRHFVKYNV